MTAKTRKQAFDESVPGMTNEQIEEGLKMGRVAVGFCAEPVMLDKEEVGFIAFPAGGRRGRYACLPVRPVSPPAPWVG